MSRFVFGGRSLDGDTNNIQFELRGRGWVKGAAGWLRGGSGRLCGAVFIPPRGGCGLAAGWLRGETAKACDTSCVQIARWLRDES